MPAAGTNSAFPEIAGSWAWCGNGEVVEFLERGVCKTNNDPSRQGKSVCLDAQAHKVSDLMDARQGGIQVQVSQGEPLGKLVTVLADGTLSVTDDAVNASGAWIGRKMQVKDKDIVGKWRRGAKNELVVFKADGTCSCSKNMYVLGEWTCTNKQAQKYQISWRCTISGSVLLDGLQDFYPLSAQPRPYNGRVLVKLTRGAEYEKDLLLMQSNGSLYCETEDGTHAWPARKVDSSTPKVASPSPTRPVVGESDQTLVGKWTWTFPRNMLSFVRMALVLIWGTIRILIHATDRHDGKWVCLDEDAHKYQITWSKSNGQSVGGVRAGATNAITVLPDGSLSVENPANKSHPNWTAHRVNE